MRHREHTDSDKRCIETRLTCNSRVQHVYILVTAEAPKFFCPPIRKFSHHQPYNYIYILASTGQQTLIMASISASRINAVNRLRCSIFQTSYNPTSIRTGAKYLRARLRGPSMVKYYPKVISISKLIREFPELELVDEEEEMRLQDIATRKARGKGPPKKTKKNGMLYLHGL